MIQPCPEIEAIVRRWTDLIRAHKVQDLPWFLSQSDALTYLGTADGELWRGQLVRDGIADHLAEVPDFAETETEIRAWQNGNTGWATYRSRFRFHATGYEGVHRVTFVFVMERGGWKMIQHHISQADGNVEKMGIEHQAFQRLIDAARDGFAQTQAEGMATVMFTDIVESSALAQVMGDRAWTDVVSRHFAMIRKAVEGQGGRLVKSLGDGTMSSFPSARAALTAAAAIRADIATSRDEPPLGVRIGMHTGDVIQTDDDFFGTVVNKAARIATTAAPGEILASDATRLMVGGADFAFSDPVTVGLKGLAGEHVLFRLETAR